jgi:nitroreductase
MTKTNKAISNAVLDCIHNRRSTRVYEDRQIEPGELNALLDAAIWAPSGGNNQGWLFTAIQNKAVLSRINEPVREGFQNWTPDDEYPGKLASKEHSQKEGYSCFRNAPTLIIASNIPNYENAMADCAIGLQNIFLAAESMGLGSCYINQLHWLRDDAPLRDYLAGLGIPLDHVICASAAIGYIAKPSATPPRKENTVLIVD